MAPYLPQSGAGSGGSPFSEGGALYALGLIHANHGEGIKQFLRDSLRSTNVEVLVCLRKNKSVFFLRLNFLPRLFVRAGCSAWCLLRSWVGSFRDC